MNNFSELGIKEKPLKHLVGDKVHINQILNVAISVHDFKIEPSKYKEGKECLHLQIEKSGNKRVVFIGSQNLINQIKEVPIDKFPFETTIKLDGYLKFT